MFVRLKLVLSLFKPNKRPNLILSFDKIICFLTIFEQYVFVGCEYGNKTNVILYEYFVSFGLHRTTNG